MGNCGSGAIVSSPCGSGAAISTSGTKSITISSIVDMTKKLGAGSATQTFRIVESSTTYSTDKFSEGVFDIGAGVSNQDLVSGFELIVIEAGGFVNIHVSYDGWVTEDVVPATKRFSYESNLPISVRISNPTGNSVPVRWISASPA